MSEIMTEGVGQIRSNPLRFFKIFLRGWEQGSAGEQGLVGSDPEVVGKHGGCNTAGSDPDVARALRRGLIPPLGMPNVGI